MVQTVYLDQNAWINLARAHYGKAAEWKVAHDAVVDAVVNGSARFPLSMSNVTEIAKRRDDASRGRLVDFVREVWSADAIRPWPDMLVPEAQNAVRHIIGQKPIDLSRYVFGKGLTHTVGAKPPMLVPKRPTAKPLTPEKLRDLTDAIMGPKSIDALKDPGIAADMRGTLKHAAADADRIQGAIDRDYSHEDKMKRRDIAESRFAMDVMLPRLLGAMSQLAPNRQVSLGTALSSKENVRALRRVMPTFNTFFELNHARNTARRYHPNDIMDSAIFNAIRYSDVVYTERSWCSVAKKAGLDQLYGTRTIYTASDLASALARKSSLCRGWLMGSWIRTSFSPRAHWTAFRPVAECVAGGSTSPSMHP